MRIGGIRTIEGPNVHHSRPVLVMRLYLDELEGRETREFGTFNDDLLALLPGLAKHHCGLGREGGFVERLRTGTYFGHVVEHVALEAAGLLGSPVTFGKTRAADEPGLYDVIVRYRSEHTMRRLLAGAVELVEALLRGETYDLASLLADAERVGRETDLGPSTLAIVRAAERRGIPWRRLNHRNLVQLGHGRHRKLIQAAVTSNTSHVAVDIACDKALTKQVLDEAGVPVPDGHVVTDLAGALDALERLGGPVVVKPLDGNQGRGITVGVDKPVRMVAAFEQASQRSRWVIVERQLPGRDYRALVVGGRLVGVCERRPPHVVGDGRSTVEELVAEANADPRRGDGHERPLTKIALDAEVEAVLGEAGMSPGFVPAKDQVVVLKRAANLSVGGTAVDVTDTVHPDFRWVVERAAAVVGLDVCGVDVIAADAAGPFEGGVVEVNASPGLRMHVSPSEGAAREVGDAIVAGLFPPGTASRVPICAVTGTNGKTTVTRLIGHVLGAAGEHVGMTTTDGVYSAGRLTRRGDNTGPTSARSVLADPLVSAAVLETARGGILRRGLGYDWSDVGVVTNVSLDHVGQDGIQDVEDLVWIKSLVAERVRDGGTLVLNADDAESAGIARLERVDVDRLQVVYFSVDGAAPEFRDHVAAGGTGYAVDDGWIVQLRGSASHRVVDLADVALASGGARFQVENCLAAAAAAVAMGASLAAVAQGLRSFDSRRDNPGRANMYALGAGCVVVDYGHNAAAFTAWKDLVSAWPGPSSAVIGVPGDRRDDVIREGARAAAQVFDRILVREDEDRRGRRPGEVPTMIVDEVRRAFPGKPCSVVGAAMGALREAAADVAAGELLVFYYESFSEVEEVLLELGATPVSSLSELEGALPRAASMRSEPAVAGD